MAMIELTAKQRILLEVLLDQQRGAVSDIEVFYDVKNKIKLDNRESFLRQLPTGEIIIDEVATSTCPVESFDLEKEERKRILELLVSHKSFSPSDLAWILPIKKQLELVL